MPFDVTWICSDMKPKEVKPTKSMVEFDKNLKKVVKEAVKDAFTEEEIERLREIYRANH